MVARDVSRSLQVLVDRFGGVSLHRIGIDPLPGTATEADRLKADGMLDGGCMLPGLKIPLRKVLAVGKHPKPKRKG